MTDSQEEFQTDAKITQLHTQVIRLLIINAGLLIITVIIWYGAFGGKMPIEPKLPLDQLVLVGISLFGYLTLCVAMIMMLGLRFFDLIIALSQRKDTSNP